MRNDAQRLADVPWQDVAGMRNHLAHRYFDTNHAIVAATVEFDLPPLVAATRRLLESIEKRLSTDRLDGKQLTSESNPSRSAQWEFS